MSEHSSGSVDAFYRLANQVAGMAVTPTLEAKVSCVLWRATANELEVLLMRRVDEAHRLGGHWVWPTSVSEQQVPVITTIGPDESALVAVLEGLSAEFEGKVEGGAGAWSDGSSTTVTDGLGGCVITRWLVSEVSLQPVLVQPGTYIDCKWITPKDVLGRWRGGDWLLSPDVARLCSVLAESAPRQDEIAAHVRGASAEPASRLWFPVQGVGVCSLRTPTLPPATTTNCCVVAGDRAIVVDPATPFEDEQEVLIRSLRALERRGSAIHQVWLTHHHGDHVGAAERIAREFGVPIAAHPRTAELLRDVVPVTLPLLDNQLEDLGGETPRRLRVIHTPGHAEGHLCFLEESTGFLIAGDMVAGIGTILIDPSEGDMTLYLSSLRAMEALAPRALLPAHGEVIVQAEQKLRTYVAHRLWREAEVMKALDELGAATPAELVPVAYRDAHPAVYPLAERSLLSHLYKLRAEGRACDHRGAWSSQ